MTQLRPATTRLVGDPPPRKAEAPASRKRLLGVDAARGVSLLGMITLHALYTSDAAGQPTWSSTLFSGRASAAFALLAGVSVALATGRRQVRVAAGRGVVAALAGRAVAIGAIGLALGHVDSVLDSVILAYIAVMFLLTIPLVFLPTWTVGVIGAAVATVMPALSHVLRPHLPDPSLENATFGLVFDHPVGMLTELTLTGFYPAVPWMAYLCAGLVIGRLDLTRRNVAAGLLGTGTVLAVAASAVSSVLLRSGGLAHIWAAQPDSGLSAAQTTELLTFGGEGTTPTATWWWLAVDSRHTGTPCDLLGTAGVAIALLGAMLLAGHLSRPTGLRWLVTAVQTPLAAVGTLTLSCYAGHIVFINSDYDSYDATTGWLVQVVAVLVIGLAWWTMLGRGPLEGLVVAVSTRARRWATAASRPTPPQATAAPTDNAAGPGKAVATSSCSTRQHSSRDCSTRRGAGGG